MNTFPLDTMGLPLPGCDSATFHLMFLSLPQAVGALFSAERPFPAGPRKAGQSSAEADPIPTSTPSVRAKSPVFIVVLQDSGRHPSLRPRENQVSRREGSRIRGHGERFAQRNAAAPEVQPPGPRRDLRDLEAAVLARQVRQPAEGAR